MIDMGMTEDQLKALVFEIYSAGYEDGHYRDINLVAAYNQYWDRLMRDLKNYLKEA